MSGSLPNFRQLRSQLRETEARLKPPIPASPPRLGREASNVDPYLRQIALETEEIEQELARTAPTEIQQSFVEGESLQKKGRRHLESIRKDMADLDKELGGKLSFEKSEEDDLCVSSASEHEESIAISPFRYTTQTGAITTEKDFRAEWKIPNSDWQVKDKPGNTSPSKSSDDRIKSLEKRLQGANASIRALERSLKEKDLIIKELEEELQSKLKTLENYHSQNSVITTYQKSVLTQSSLTSQMRKKERELEKRLKDSEAKVADDKKTIARLQHLNSSMIARVKELEAAVVPSEDVSMRKKKTSKKLKSLREDNKQLANIAKELQNRLAEAEYDYDTLDGKYQSLLLKASDYEEQSRGLVHYTRLLVDHLQRFLLDKA